MSPMMSLLQTLSVLTDFWFAADLMGGGFNGWKDDDDEGGQEDDEDLMNDPIVTMNMRVSLRCC